ncbi:MAG: GPW/gp25 family protein [Bryobacteraceae bacterium]|jgi:phage baseplate assembly protein W
MNGSSAGRHLSFPFRVAADGRAASADTLARQVLEELVQLILTNQGERLFLPDFGAGARRLLFEGINDTTATMSRTMITQAVQQWLPSRVTLNQLTVTVNDTTIEIDLVYQVAGTDQIRQAIFQRSAPSS